MVASTEKDTESKNVEIVEKRVKRTVIRRRARKVEPAAVETPAEETVVDAKPAVSEPVTQDTPAAAKAAEPVPSADVEPDKPVKATEETSVPAEDDKAPVRKIGVVGHIDELASNKVKEDWKEREKQQVKPPARKRRSTAEIEEAKIRRAGGLRHYADDLMSKDDVGAARSDAKMGERVFQPKATGKRRKTGRRGPQKQTSLTEPKAIKKVIRIEDGITVSGLSQATGQPVNEIIKQLMSLEVMATANQTIETEVASIVAQEFGYKVENVGFKEEEVLSVDKESSLPENLKPRPPVVTVMGHVDHGKTSVLDVIRKASVADREAGGITQHIGAYQVNTDKGVITFIDTPGHAAFTSMRARGAQVTDIVILVVAADDGVMPQTIEAIDHSKAAGVPIIVAVNKIDKEDAQPDRVLQALTEHELVPEDWGGDIICVPTSAKTGEGIDKLLEMILLQSEVLELKADPTIRPHGVVIEAKLDKGRGPVATVLVKEGELKPGQLIVCGAHHGKVRAMLDENGKPKQLAGPSTPVEIQGLSGVPTAGDEAVGVESEQQAKQVSERRSQKMRQDGLASLSRSSLEELQEKLLQGEVAELVTILKADVHGSVEAVTDSLVKLSTDKVKVKVLHKGVGGIAENDVLLASASNALVLGFNVKPDAKARSVAERENVDIKTYRIIYEMIDDVKKAMEGLLAPIESELSLGMAEVREVFKVSKVGQISGCLVTSGKIQRNCKGRLLRDQVIVFEGNISSLKRFKDDAKEVAETYECGIGLENFNDIKVGDIIEAYKIEQKAAKL